MNNQIKPDQLITDFLDTTKASIQWFENIESLENKKNLSFLDWVIFSFNSLNVLVCASKTIDSGKEYFAAFQTTRIEPSKMEIMTNQLNLNLTPSQLCAINPCLYLLSLPK